MKHVVSIFLALVCAVPCIGQTAEFTIGVGQPVKGVPLLVYALVSNPAHSPVPAGSVNIDYGDGVTESGTLVNGSYVFKHTYTATVPVTITANYSGGQPFAPATASQRRVVLASAPPPVSIYMYGSSSTYGTASSSLQTRYTSLVAAAEGWTEVNHGESGGIVSTLCNTIYAHNVSAEDRSSFLIGRNELSALQLSATAHAEYQHALTACYAWLLIPNNTPQKLIAQDRSVVSSGSWTSSDIHPTMGLLSTKAGSSLQFTLPGSAVYVGLTAKSGSSTVSVSIDGGPETLLQPVAGFSIKQTYGGRILIPGSSQTTRHTVTLTCTVPGASGCYVDWVGSNGAAAKLTPPFLWAMTVEEEATGLPLAWFDQTAVDVKQVYGDLLSDGFPIYLDDVERRLSGVATRACFAGDGLHPFDCGHQIIASTLIAAINPVISALQRIDFAPLSGSVSAGSSVALVASASSGLPVTLSVVSGPAAIQGTNLVISGPGKVVVAAEQPGSDIFYPAPQVVQTVTAVSSGANLQVSATSVGFGLVAMRAASAAKSLTLANTGTAAINGLALSFTGANAADFSQSGTCGTVLAAGATCTVNLTFRPTTSGTEQASLAIQAAGLGVQYVALTGTGLRAQVWVVNSNGTISALTGSGAPLSDTPWQGGGVGIVVDDSEAVWSINNSSSVSARGGSVASSGVAKFSGSGTLLNASAGVAVSGTPANLTVDGAGQIWLVNANNSITALDNNGLPIAAAPYTSGNLSAPSSIAVDGSGNLWITNAGNDTLTEVVGAAVPLIKR
ncbi:hypothetical protein BH10ACI4_BH10ACI4_03290 [soil metagenome]